MAAGHVIVVGGGLAGLSAAIELKRSNFSVELFERSRLLGGKATSFEIDGIEIDNGQHVILACCTEFIDFVRRLDSSVHARAAGLPADGSLVLQDRFEALLLQPHRPPVRMRAVRLPAPLHMAPALLRYRYLTPASRLRIAWALARASDRPRQGETFAAWLRRHRQRDDSFRAFWDPFFIPALNAPLDRVSAEAGLFVIQTAFLDRSDAACFGFARVPLARIARAAADSLDRIHLRTAVVGLHAESLTGAATDIRGVVLDNGDVVRCDAIVLAVPPPRLQRLVENHPALGIAGLDAFQTAPIADVHLWYDRNDFGFGFAALLGSPVQWVFEKGPGYLCCSMSAAADYTSLPNAELIELCHQELVAVLPQLAGVRRLRAAATRDRDATFVPTPGLQRPGPATGSPRVTIAGAWTDTGWPATMESAVRSGRAAARTLITSLRGLHG
jgi:squalene-associated FAD-dependent desaturase